MSFGFGMGFTHNEPFVGGPSLNLQFAGANTLSSQITFTRAGVGGTYINSAGVITAASADQPRFDYDPVTLAALGLLIEESRQNLLLNSTTLSTQSVTVAAVAHTLSFYGTGTVTLSGASTAGPLVGTGNFPTRVSLTFTPTAGTLTLTVTGTVQYAQLEAGAFATSYIPTTTTPITRAADSATINTLSPWFNSSEGTLYAQADTYDVSSSRVSFLIFDGTSNNIISEAHGAVARGFIASGGVTQLTQLPGSVSNNTVSKTALAYKVNDGQTAVNGTAAVVDTSVTIPSVTQARIGSFNATNSVLNGHIRNITYYPRRLSQAELITLTT